LAKQNEYSAQNQPNKAVEFISPETITDKKPFVEPELSPAVDVLEATTFFQGLTSSGT